MIHGTLDFTSEQPRRLNQSTYWSRFGQLQQAGLVLRGTLQHSETRQSPLRVRPLESPPRALIDVSQGNRKYKSRWTKYSLVSRSSGQRSSLRVRT